MPPKTRKRARAEEEEELDGKTCFDRIRGFQSINEFLNEIPEEDYSRYVTKAIKSQKSNKIKCIECDKTFASSSGFIQHIRKCEQVKVEPEDEEEQQQQEEDEWAGSTYAQFKLVPTIWLKVERERQNDVLDMICKGNYRCFGNDCTSVFRNLDLLLKHLNYCIVPTFASFQNNLEGIRELNHRTRTRIVREALEQSPTGRLQCIECDKTFKNVNGMTYHLDRCNLDKMQLKWTCVNCDFVGQNHQKEQHLLGCIQSVNLVDEKKMGRRSRSSLPKVDPDFVPLMSASGESEDEDILSDADETPKKHRSGCRPRLQKGASEQGSVRFRFRKSEIFRGNNSSVNKFDQERYEENCQKKFEQFKSRKIGLCQKLSNMESPTWVKVEKDENNPVHLNLNRTSVTIKTGYTPGTQTSIPEDGVRIECLESAEFEVPDREEEKITVGYCGVPINSIKTAPNKMNEEEDLICVCTFPNETDFVGDSSLVQFWRFSNNQLLPHFLLNLPNFGTVLAMEWLNVQSNTNFAAFAMSKGEILIYRIDFESIPDIDETVPIVESAPALIIRQPETEMVRDVMPPICRISWLWQNGGQYLAAINAAGSLLIWNIDEDTDMPNIHRDPSWASPPTDLAFLDTKTLVVAFREKLVRVIKFGNDMQIYLQDSSAKIAGQRVTVDSRVFKSFFSYHAEYNSSEKMYGTGINYFSITHEETPSFTIIPLFNLHQLMTSQVAVHPSRGIIASCGIDGRLIASANGKITDDERLQSFYSASRHLLLLTRKRVEKEEKTVEPTCYEHETVCENMWIEMDFDKMEMHKKAQLSCRDQRIESLNALEMNTDFENPTVFCGGEAGLLFVVPCSLKIK